MSDLFLLNYNNYYNRIIKKETTLQDYEKYLVADVVRNYNFVENNGLQTECIINSNAFNVQNSPDYIVVVTSGTYDIASKWFVMNTTKLRNGQFKLTLKRDVIAENFDAVLDSDAFIYKGYALPDNVAIFNSENITLNKIKQKEILLKDYTKTPWLVAYVPVDLAQDNPTIEVSLGYNYDQEYTNQNQYPYNEYLNQNLTIRDNTYFLVPYRNPTYTGGGAFRLNCNSSRTVSLTTGMIGSTLVVNQNTISTSQQIIQNNFKGVATSDLNVTGVNIIDNNIYEQILNENGKVIKIGTTLYKIVVSDITDSVSVPEKSKADMVIQRCFTNVLGVYTTLNNKSYPEQVTKVINYNYNGIKITLELLKEASEKKYKINLAGVDLTCEDAAYAIITTPFIDNANIKNNGEDQSEIITKENRMKILQALGSASGRLYDLQILPYSPIRNLIIDNNNFETPVNVGMIKITDEDSNYITSLYVCNKSSFSFKIFQTISIDDVKISNTCDTMRLVSPNHSNTFEFTPAKFFDGDLNVIKYFNVDVTLKPFQPFIHISPNFSGLYGYNFNDARGLILGGNYSLDLLSDQWETYELQNKNWQLMFNRQIESLELNKNIGLASSIINGLGSTFAGTISGGLFGGLFGNSASLASLGGLTNIGQSIYNTVESQYLQQYNIDSMKLNKQWEIQNIQARPMSITNVSAYNKINKYFPFLEFYSCTKEERELVKNKIKYEGMTISRIDKISKYVYNDQHFLSAKILRSNIIESDLALISEINKELSQGVYIND